MASVGDANPGPPDTQGPHEDLRTVVQSHALWLRTHGKEGKQAKLSGSDLHGQDLSGDDLRDAELCLTNLTGAKLSGTSLVHSDLRGAVLNGASELTAPQLGGADLTCAKMDKDFDSNDPVDSVNNQIRDCGRTLLGLGVLCSCSLLTIASMTDIVLIAGTGTMAFPGQGAPITTVGFYYAVPVVIFVLFLTFVLYLQRMWESLIKIPSIRRDGTMLYDRLAPWLPTGLIWMYYPQLKDRRPAMWWMQIGLSTFLLWWIVPCTLHAFWARTLCVHDPVLSSLLAFLAAASIVVAAGTWQLAEVTLNEGLVRAPSLRLTLDRILRPRYVAAVLIVLVVYPLLSILAFTGGSRLELMPDRPIPEQGIYLSEWAQQSTLRRMLYCPFADVGGAQLSTKPDNLTDANLEQVDGPNLLGRDLRSIRAGSSYMVNADLRSANLDNAIMDGADLRLARLDRASLQCAKLTNADLRGAVLEGTIMHGADLRGAKLQGAKLAGCDLEEADLRGAQLNDEVEPGKSATNVRRPPERRWGEAQSLDPDQLHSAVYNDTTTLPPYISDVRSAGHTKAPKPATGSAAKPGEPASKPHTVSAPSPRVR